MLTALTAPKLFTGKEWLEGHAIVVENNTIKEIVPLDQLGRDIKMQTLETGLLVPAFIDVQVYGAAGKLLAVYPEAATLQTMYEEFLKEGTVLCQPTVATNTIEVFKQCIDAVRSYKEHGGKGIYGLHLEGPWLNADKRGAHIKEWIHAPSEAEVKDLLDYGQGIVTMITLAPEVCSDEIIRLIRSYNIILSAGHSNTSYQRAIESFNKGITTVTHLYNAMSPLQHRAPGLVGAAFNHPTVMASIIPDGYHVDFPAVIIAKKVMGERLFAITDAVTETTIGPYQHYLAGEKYESNGILSGSALTMYKAFRNLVNKTGMDKGEALRMCSLYPAQALQCDDRYGKIAPGCAAIFVALRENLDFIRLITV